MIIVHILPRDFLKVAVVESQDMVQALTTKAAEKAFANGVRVGCATQASLGLAVAATCAIRRVACSMMTKMKRARKKMS